MNIRRLLILCLFPVVSAADPWLPPGDLSLRHDIELLADAGIVRGPVTTWPISWPDIARDVLAATSAPADAALQSALARIQRAARRAAAPGWSGWAVRASASEEPIALRSFAATSRDQGEIELGSGYLGERWAARVVVTGVANPADDQDVRFDGSYIGISLGNFMISAGAMEHWWGPGWEGSLVLSNNARPIPSFTVERNYTEASRRPVLRWFGPWRASIAIGQTDRNRVAVPDVRFFAARVNFKPRPWLEFGLSRTAQWCGEGRPCSLSVFKDLLFGRDNRDASLTVNDEPGNQMAGYDMRLRSPWRRLPAAFYMQMIGEDEANHLPSKFLGLLGGEIWGGGEFGSWRLHAEYADTSCSFARNNPQFDCAYRNGLYPQGYVYRGRVIGHTLDSDGRMTSLGALWLRPSGDSVSVLVRSITLNRDGGVDAANTQSTTRRKLSNVELGYNRDVGPGHLQIGAGYDDVTEGVDAGSTVRGFIQWQQEFD
ncbi:MAG: capsule assembly Wzi family protein [Steroidobacteraceae bacterium]